MMVVGYWKALMASPDFRGHTMKACLNVLHKDIVTVWNFKDTEHVRPLVPCFTE